jgi:hypothetical protein
LPIVANALEALVTISAGLSSSAIDSTTIIYTVEAIFVLIACCADAFLSPASRRRCACTAIPAIADTAGRRDQILAGIAVRVWQAIAVVAIDLVEADTIILAGVRGAIINIISAGCAFVASCAGASERAYCIRTGSTIFTGSESAFINIIVTQRAFITAVASAAKFVHAVHAGSSRCAGVWVAFIDIDLTIIALKASCADAAISVDLVGTGAVILTGARRAFINIDSAGRAFIAR